MRFRETLLVIAVIVCLASSAARAASSEEQRFVEALRDQKWYDTAMEYLDWVGNQPNASAGFKQRAPYERALVLAAKARQSANRQQREAQLRDAARAFEKLARAKRGDPSLLSESLQEASTLYAELALTAAASAKRLPEQAMAQRVELMKKAGGWFEKSSAATKQLIEVSQQQFKALPKAAAANAKQKIARTQLGDQIANAQYRLGKLDFEHARSLPKGSAKAEEMLKRSSKIFNQVFTDHDQSLVGYYSRLYQGRALQALGDFAKALGCYEDITTIQTSDPEFRRLISRAHRRRSECFLEQENFEEAIIQSQQWLRQAQKAEREKPEWLAVAFRLSEALEAKATTKDGKEAQQLRSEVRVLLRDVSRSPGEFQNDARLALVGESAGPQEDATYATFADALTAGKTSLELMSSSRLAAKLAKENNPAAEAELATRAHSYGVSSIKAFRAALELADRETKIEDLNMARYNLCLLFWEEKKLHETAVLGEFLARRYPQSPYQSGASRLALVAYEQLYNQARQASAGNREAAAFEAAQLSKMAQLVASRSAGSPEASAAVNLLIKIALAEDRVQDAQQLLAKLPQESRGSAQMVLGTALWTQSQRASQGTGGEPTPQVKGLRDQAAQVLRSGFQSLSQAGTPTTTEAVGVLCLAQLQLAEGKASQAIATLESPQVGPLSLASKKSKTVSNPKFLHQIYETGLRAYLSVDPPQRKQAQAMMGALERSATAIDPSGKRLTQVYLRLGLQLQAQIQQLNASGKTQQASGVARAFEDLLQRVAQRKDADSWSNRNWIAQASLQMGERLEGKAATSYLKRAKTNYQAILLSAQQDPKYAPPGALLRVRVRLADCERALGNYKQALEQYGRILKSKPSLLEVQKAAAEALQDQGVTEKQSAKLDQAIRGAMPVGSAGKNLVWGWLKLATVADQAKRRALAGGETQKSRAARYEDLFFEARFNIAKCRYLSATVGPPIKRSTQLNAAKKNVQSMKNLYPELGGAKWKAAFDRLLTQIDKELKR